jgi:hypothetical protein
MNSFLIPFIALFCASAPVRGKGPETLHSMQIVAIHDSGFVYQGFASISIDTQQRSVEIDLEGAQSTLTAAEVDRLEDAVRAAGFFALAPHYGYDCFECGACEVRIVAGGRRHQVRVNRYTDTLPTKQERDEIARLFRLWDVVKSVADRGGVKDACR